MLRFKRSINVFISSMLVTSILFGCTKTGDKAPEESTTKTEIKNTETKETAESLKTSNNPLTEPLALPLVEPGTIELTVATMENNFPSASFAENLPVYEEFEKMTGVKIKWEVYPQNDYDSIMATRLATGKGLPDIFVVPWEMDADKIGIDGMAIPINDLIPQNAFYLNRLFEMNPTVKKGLIAGDGNIYAYPGFGEGIITGAKDMETGKLENPGANITLFTPGIRKDWLDKLGLDEPKTLDDWYDVLKAFKTGDPNGNGKADEIPFSPTFNYEDIFMMGSGYGLYKKDKDVDYWAVDGSDKISFKPTDPRFKDLLIFLNKLYKEGLLDPEFAGVGYSKTAEKINMDMVGSLAGNWNSNYASYNNNLSKAGIEDANWISIKPPADPDGSQKIFNRWSTWKVTAISKDCKYPELALKWIDMHCLSPEGITLQNFGIEGVSYEKNSDGTLKFTDFVMKNPDGLGAYEALRSLGAWGQISYIQTKDANLAINADSVAQLEFAKSFKENDVLQPLPDDFSYTKDELSVRSEIYTTVTTMMDENNIAFITGSRSLDEFDKYIEELNGAGLENLIKITQDAYNRFKAS